MKAFASGTFSESGSCFIDLEDFPMFHEAFDIVTVNKISLISLVLINIAIHGFVFY